MVGTPASNPGQDDSSGPERGPTSNALSRRFGGSGSAASMLIASLFLLWMVVILLVVAVVALSRQVRAMQEGAGGVRPAPWWPCLAALPRW
ncbi:hypothetical protein OSJ57_09210 [Sphingomonas sp. HH69]